MLQNNSETSVFVQTAFKTLSGQIPLLPALSRRQQKRATVYIFAIVSAIHPGIMALVHYIDGEVVLAFSFQENNSHLWEEFAPGIAWTNRLQMIDDFVEAVSDFTQNEKDLPRYLAALPPDETKKFLTAFVADYKAPQIVN